MGKKKKPFRKFTARYATDEDYKRMNFYTIGMLYWTDTIMARRENIFIDRTPNESSARKHHGSTR
jgi:hypothetical protein